MSRSKTHFEQVPLATVKKIIAEHPELMQENELVSGIPTEESELNDAINGASKPADCASPGEDWRELAQRVNGEPDPEKMIGLVQQLITKLDEEQQRKNPPPSLAPRSLM